MLQILSLFINKLFTFQIIDNLTLKKLRNNDFFRVFRFKKLSFYPTELTRLYQAAHFGNIILLTWVILSKSTLITKRREMQIATNYRPNTYFNIMNKRYTYKLFQ